MRILGIDYGHKRIGLAVSDETAAIASPAGSVEEKSVAAAVAAIAKLAAQRSIGKIIVGLPKNMDGSLGPKALEALAFAEKLKAHVSVPVQMWDERLTTKAAQRAMIEAGASRAKRRKKVDTLSAQLILQSYLDSQHPMHS